MITESSDTLRNLLRRIKGGRYGKKRLKNNPIPKLRIITGKKKAS